MYRGLPSPLATAAGTGSSAGGSSVAPWARARACVCYCRYARGCTRMHPSVQLSPDAGPSSHLLHQRWLPEEDGEQVPPAPTLPHLAEHRTSGNSPAAGSRPSQARPRRAAARSAVTCAHGGDAAPSRRAARWGQTRRTPTVPACHRFSPAPLVPGSPDARRYQRF